MCVNICVFVSAAYCICSVPNMCLCVWYLNVATQLQVGQPITKLLSGFVLPSHTSSMQPAVHISHTRTWAFCLKWLADLGAETENAHMQPYISASHPGINLITMWRTWQAAKMFQSCFTETHICTYLALAITSMSLKRKRCLSWVCIPVFNWACPWRRNDLSEPVRNDWISGHFSGHMGTRKLSLEYK